jgi:hypothetical protein
MSRKKAIVRRHERRKSRIKRATTFLLGNLVYAILGGAILLFATAVIASVQHIPSSVADSPNATKPNANWIPLTSKSPKAIIAAARKSALFNVDRSGNGDYLKDLSHLENPILVRAIHTPGSIAMPDYYVIPIDDASGAIIAAAQLELNKAHSAIQVSAIITYPSPRPHGHLAQVSMATAMTNVSRQQHAPMKAGATGTLVYFPVDASLQETGKIVWKGGGEDPTDPVWLIPGANGQNHVVGTNGYVYAMSDLPIMKQP